MARHCRVNKNGMKIKLMAIKVNVKTMSPYLGHYHETSATFAHIVTFHCALTVYFNSYIVN